MARPRLAFVSFWDASDPNVESGYAYSMRRQLQKSFDVVDLFPLVLPYQQWALPLRAAYRAIGQYYHPMREPGALRRLGSRVLAELATSRPDVVFSPTSLPLSFVAPPVPWIFATDQVFRDFCGTYISRPAERFKRLGEVQERRALNAAARASFPSTWAAESAVNAHAGDPNKIAVIPWGANLRRIPSRETVEAALANRCLDGCRLVFLGRDWQRKGGPTLVEVVRLLNERGIVTRAAIIGCTPPGLDPRFFDVLGPLNRLDARQDALLTDLMLTATCFFLASRAEAYGQVFCEAAAFGLPSIATAVGGIPTIIRDRQTGYLLPPTATAQHFADLIGQVLADRPGYERMARAARADYEERLNWDAFGRQLTGLISEVL